MPKKKKIINILFVCLGNICRSPAGAGVLLKAAEKRGLKDDLHVESCGIGGWHIGLPPDARMQEAMSRREVTIGSKAQQFEVAYLEVFDYILAADFAVYDELIYLAGDESPQAERIHMMTEFSRAYQGEEIPDPYREGPMGFELVLDMLEDSCEGLLDHIAKEK